jgi:hypothetical protein
MVVHYIFKYTWIIRWQKTSDQYRFNFYHPLAWLVLLFIAFNVGLFEGLRTMFNTIKDVVKDAAVPLPTPASPQEPTKTPKLG